MSACRSLTPNQCSCSASIPSPSRPFAVIWAAANLGDAASVDGFGSYLTPFLVERNTVLIGQSVAERYGLQPGQLLPIRIGARREMLKIIGLLVPSDELSRRALDGLLIVDISTAQELLGKVGRLDRIDLIVPPGAEGNAKLDEIRRIPARRRPHRSPIGPVPIPWKR